MFIVNTKSWPLLLVHATSDWDNFDEVQKGIDQVIGALKKAKEENIRLILIFKTMPETPVSPRRQVDALTSSLFKNQVAGDKRKQLFCNNDNVDENGWKKQKMFSTNSMLCEQTNNDQKFECNQVEILSNQMEYVNNNKDFDTGNAKTIDSGNDETKKNDIEMETDEMSCEKKELQESATKNEEKKSSSFPTPKYSCVYGYYSPYFHDGHTYSYA